MARHTATRSRLQAIVGFATAAAALWLSATAWACSPTPDITLQTASGLAGSRVLVSGTYFAPPADGQPNPITIHWASASGPVLATMAGPTFSVYVVVPVDAAPGPYVIGAAQSDSRLGDVWRAQSFTVRSTSSTATTTPPGVPAGTDPAPEPQSEPASSLAQASTSPAGSSVGSAVAAPAATQVASPTAAVVDRRDAAPAPTSSAAVARATSPAAPAAPSARPSALPVGLPAASQAGAPVATASDPGASPVVDPQPASGPESAALPQGVWSTDAARRGIDVDRGFTSPGAAGAAGVVFLAIGVTLLLAGFLAVTVTRRRGLARGTRPPTP